MSETIEVVQKAKRNKYSWSTLVNVGDSFMLTEADGAGLKFARQLVFAKNKTMQKQGKTDSYKCEKVTDGMKVIKVS